MIPSCDGVCLKPGVCRLPRIEAGDGKLAWFTPSKLVDELWHRHMLRSTESVRLHFPTVLTPVPDMTDVTAVGNLTAAVCVCACVLRVRFS